MPIRLQRQRRPGERKSRRRRGIEGRLRFKGGIEANLVVEVVHRGQERLPPETCVNRQMPVHLVIVLDIQIHGRVPQVTTHFSLQVEVVRQTQQHVRQGGGTVSAF